MHLKNFIPRRVRNWVKSPAHSLIWLRDDAKHHLGSNPAAQIRTSWSLRCHPAAYRFVCREQIDDPEQRKELDAFIASITQRTVLFDIGAHFGIFSFATMHYGGPTARAIAVDASPVAVRMIRTQMRLNGITPDSITCIQAIVSDNVGEGEMVPVGVIAGGYYVAPSPSHTAADRARVRMTTVDELALENRITPTHLKIDVEGAEAAVLRGAMKTLAKHSPILCLELHHAMVRRIGGNPQAVFNLLKELSYHLFDTNGQAVTAEDLLTQNLVRVVARKSS